MKKLWIIIASFLIAFIFLHSVVPENKSASESLWFTEEILNPFLNVFGKTGDNIIVRKVAHIFEFFLLTVILFVLFKKSIRVFYASFTLAFLDESIQILTKRGASISDVWIDLVGVILGLLLCLAINKVKTKFNKVVRCNSVEE